MKFAKDELVWFDVGNGQEPGRVVELSAVKNTVTVIQTNTVVGSQPRMFQLIDLTRVKKRGSTGNVQIHGGRNGPRTWLDEESGINDMIQLTELSENSILQNLHGRFIRNVIYTSIGSILVAVNPYKMFSETYSLDMVKTYENIKRLSDLPPHLFTIGSTVFHQMNKEHEDQVVIISGESGAGKTESTKLIMRYLAALNKSASNLITEQILEANPLLESFGNAKTIRNDNSSRFGKYLAIFFSKQGTITGAKITEYLLEKSRICTHADDERNYHVFYELLAGLTKDEKTTYGLQEEKNYYYLNQGGDSKMPSKNDAADFQALRSAMQVLNFSQTECDTVFKILASVLHLGNIRFKSKQVEYQAEGVVVERESEVRWAAHLLEIPDTGIISALTTKTTEARNEKLLTPLNRDQAFDARDAIAKALYSRLFTWLVDRTNQIVSQNQDRNSSIALLDIFGFEDFKENSFEQLCINYANETLQFCFNQHIFKLEQQEYAKEKIVWQQIEFADNQLVLDLIAKKPVGILHILDDESSFPKATDQSFLEKCHYNHGTNPLYQRPRTLHPSFTIKHYAGQVSYTVTGFLDKNRDTLRADVIELFIGSSVPMVSKMFQEWKDSSDFVKTVKRGAGRFVTMKPRTPTVSARFQESLNSLVESMSKCRPHFVRCVKPNNNKAPMVFEDKIVLDQLRYTGMLETIRIRKIGYPVRIKFIHFINQTKLPQRYSDMFEDILDVKNIAIKSKLPSKFRLVIVDILNELAVMERAIDYTCHEWRFIQEIMRDAQLLSRSSHTRKKYRKVKTGITRAQATIRMFRQRKWYLETTNKTKELEAIDNPRRKIARKKADEQQKAHAAADGIKSPNFPAEIAFIFSKLNEWQCPHSERNVVKVVGHVEPDKRKFEFPRDIQAYGISKFAGIYCQNGTWGPRREPVAEPFMTSLSESEKRDALEVFSLVLKFMYDSNLNEKQEKVLADYIVFKGIRNKRLRDEIYCQLCNQTWPSAMSTNTGNVPSSAQPVDSGNTEKAWSLMAHCLSAFPPSQNLHKYLLKFISDFADEGYKFTCQTKLLEAQTIDPNSCRVYPPSLLEMRTCKKHAMMSMEVSFPDSERKMGPLSSWSTASDFAKLMLQQRDIHAESQGWTTSLVSGTVEEQVELNGSDYVLDLISELELPPSFPAVKPFFLSSGSRFVKARNEPEFVARMDFGPEDDGFGSPRNTARRRLQDLSPSRPGNESQKLTRLGLAKSSKLNQRYEVDKPNLAKTSALNKRYHLVEADVAVGVGIGTRNNEHPGLSNSQLNRRYRSTQSIGHNDNDAVESDTNSDGQLMASRRKQKTTGKDNMPPKKNENRPPAKKASSSDVLSMSSQYGRVRVPSASNARDIDNYLDEIFGPVLRNAAYADEDEHVAVPDAKTLAASIKGGGSKSTKARTDMGYHPVAANGNVQPAYAYGAGAPPVLPAHLPQYTIPMNAMGTGLSPPGLTSLGYYPQIAQRFLPYPWPFGGYPPQHAEVPSLSSVDPRETHGNGSSVVGNSRPSSPLPAHSPYGYSPLIVPAAGPPVDPVFQAYLHQQNYAAQMQLQHQLSSALQQNIELQQKILQNQQEMLAVQHRPGENSDGISSPGGGSPDSLPPTPVGNGDYLYPHRPHHHAQMPPRLAARSSTPPPTTSVTKTEAEPPLPPRQYEPPPKIKPKNLSGAPPPPPPPPPFVPPRKPTPEMNNLHMTFAEEITGRARTVRIANVRWPPPLPPREDDTTESPQKRPLNLPVESHEHSTQARTPEAKSPSKLRIDRATVNKLENLLGAQSIKHNAKHQEQRNSHEVRDDKFNQGKKVTAKPAFDHDGIPVPPPLPPAIRGKPILDQSPPKLPPPRTAATQYLVDIHREPPKSDVFVDIEKRSVIAPPSSITYYAYNRTQWNMTLRKEYFTPAEKIDNPLAINLIFCQIRQDTFQKHCVRMNREEQQKMRTLFDSYGITDLESGVPSSQIKVPIKKNIIDAAKELPLYFCRLYPVATENTSSTASRRHYFGVSHNGVLWVNLDKNDDSKEVFTVIESRRFAEIMDMTMPRNSTIEISFMKSATKSRTEDDRWTFYTHKANQIKDLLEQMSAEADQTTGGGVSGELVRAVLDYRTKDPTLLSFRRGDIITLASRNQSYLDRGWLYGNIDNRWGIFPHEYVVALNRQETFNLRSTFPITSAAHLQMGNGEIPIGLKPDGENNDHQPVNGYHDTSSSTSSQRSDTSEVAAKQRATDGKLSMLEFAMVNFRQCIEKYGVVAKDRQHSAVSSIQGSIKQIERIKDASGKDWTWKEQAEMVKYSRSPIQHSLLKADDPDLNRVAVETFLSIMRFMGDYPMTKGQNDVECVYMVLMVCHKYPVLRDEVYCQIVKQTTNNKSAKPDSCQRGWRFFSIIAAYFDCSENLRPYIFKYLETAAYDKRRPYHGTALVCLQNLRKTFKFGGRKNVPSVDEIAAIAAGRSTKRQLYLLPGGTEKIINTKSTTVVEDVIMELCHQLKIDSASEMDEYSVYALRDKDDLYGFPLQYEDYILDVTTELLKTGPNFLLLFRRSVSKRDDDTPTLEEALKLFRPVVPDYLDGLLLVSPPGGLLEEEIREVSKIAALLHRSTDKTKPPDVRETKYLLPKPALVLRDPRPPQWLQTVHDFFQPTLKFSPTEAKAEFLNMLQRWTLFGSNFFFVHRLVTPIPDGRLQANSGSSERSSDSSKRVEKLLMENILAINKNGVFFLDLESRETIDHYPFSEIISTRRIKSSENGALYLDMKCGNLMSQRITRMQTDQAHEIARLIGHYIHIENSVLASKAVRNNITAEMHTKDEPNDGE